MNNIFKKSLVIFIFSSRTDDTPVQRELNDVNQRYANLRKHLIDCLDDLHVAERCNEETDNAQDTLDWVEAVNAKLDQAKPKSREIEPLREEVKAFKVRFLFSFSQAILI